MEHFAEKQHEVGIDQMFFSTTDDKGIIDLYNDVFVHLSRYNPDQLHGAPHNIIRHTDMPSAAFRAMWDTLQSGEPFAAYVRNRASDGSSYDVFATLTPLPGGGYLSVRTRPLVTELHAVALRLYRDTQGYEQRLRSDGLDRRTTALRGVEYLTTGLNSLGFTDYQAFQHAALPAETIVRERRSPGLPLRHRAQGSLHALLMLLHRLFAELDSWADDQGALNDLTQELTLGVKQLRNEIEDDSLRAGHSPQAPDSSSIKELLAVWEQMQQIVRAPVTRLVNELTALERESSQTRFKVALARLNVTMMATFTAEIIDQTDSAPRAIPSIDCLAKAVSAGLRDMSHQSRNHSERARGIVTAIEQTSSFLAIPRQLLELWQRNHHSSAAGTANSAIADQIAARIDRLSQTLNQLSVLSERCRRFSAGRSSDQLSATLDAVNHQVGALISRNTHPSEGQPPPASAF